MAGHGEKRGRKQEQALIALLECATIAEAARQVGIGENTLWRWLQEPSFQDRYREIKRQAVKQAIARLQQTSSEAVTVLREIMLNQDNPASARVSAAKTILETAIKAVEFEDLAARVETLEQIAKQRGAKG